MYFWTGKLATAVNLSFTGFTTSLDDTGDVDKADEHEHVGQTPVKENGVLRY
jgi:hypothetical protein